jgi:hypothetical protein
MEEDTAFSLVQWAILLAPPLALCSFLAIRRRPSWLRKAAFVGCAIVLVAKLLFVVFRLSFAVPSLNLHAFAVVYIAYCYIAFSCWQVRRLLFRAVVLVTAMLPMAYGYLVATLGVWGLAFAVSDYVRPPEHVELLRSGLTCRITSWEIFVNYGLVAHLYKSWTAIPFVEQEIARIAVNDADRDARAFEVSCSAVMSQHIG